MKESQWKMDNDRNKILCIFFPSFEQATSDDHHDKWNKSPNFAYENKIRSATHYAHSVRFDPVEAIAMLMKYIRAFSQNLNSQTTQVYRSSLPL